MKRIQNIIRVVCLAGFANLLMACFTQAKHIDEKQFISNLFIKNTEDFGRILGRWNADISGKDIQLNILEFSETRMKATVKVQDQTIPIQSKVNISKIIHEYKTSFKLNQKGYQGEYVLFINTKKFETLHAVLKNSSSQEIYFHFER